MLLVTGCPRSGTSSTAAALRNAGIDVLHERVGEEGSVCWFYAVEAVVYPFRVPPRPSTWTHVFHLVREPLATIASITTITQASWRFVRENIGAWDGPLIDQAARFWLRWNEVVEGYASRRFRLEDTPVAEIAAEYDPARKAQDTVFPKLNARRHPTIDWGDIGDPVLRSGCQDMAERYGYSTANHFF